MKKKVLLTSIVIGFCILLLIAGGLAKNRLNKSIASDKNVTNKTASANKSDKNANNTLNESNNAANTEENSAASNATSQSTNTAVGNTGNSGVASSTKATTGTANTAVQKQTSGSTQSNINTSQAPVSPTPVSPGTGQQGGGSSGNSQIKEPNFIIESIINGQTNIILSDNLNLDGKTVGDVTLEELQNRGILYETTGFGSGSGSTLYFKSINRLKERANGPNSGWLYYVKGSDTNGNWVTPDVSCGAYTLQAGDTVKWVYSSN